MSCSNRCGDWEPLYCDFPGGSGSKKSGCSAGDLSSTPGWEDPLEKGMAIHSSIMAWRIPWTEEPWQAAAHGVAKESDTTEQLTLTHSYCAESRV